MKKQIIRKKLESLSNLLEKLEEIISKRENSNEENIKEYLLFAAEKKAEECVELAITINQSLLEPKNKIADSYYESFIELKNFEKFEENELKQLASTTGFRNRLAHEYLNIDEEITIKSMKKILETYPGYIKKVNEMLESL